MANVLHRYIGGQGGGESASIFVTGLSQSDSVSGTKPNGSAMNAPSWVSKPNPLSHNLPSGFQEVTYIQSAGTGNATGFGGEYIDTNWYPSSNYNHYVLKFKLLNCPSVGARFYGSQYNSSYGSGFFWASSNRSDYNNTYTGTTTSTLYNLYVNTDYTLDFIANNGSGSYTINGTTKTFSYSGSVANGGTIYLGTLHQTSTPGFGTSSTQFFEYIVYDNSNVELQHFIPCYCTESKTGYQGATEVTVASGTIGMYDIVNDRFYVNSGSGAFTKGDDVAPVNGWSFPNLNDYGTYTVTATDGSITKTESVLVDTAIDYTIAMELFVGRKLYWYGEEYDSLTGGWSEQSSGSGVLTKETDHLAVDTTASWLHISTANTITLTGYTKLIFDMECSQNVGVGNRIGTVASRGSDSYTSVTTLPSTSFARTTKEVSLTGPGAARYIQFGSSGGKYNVYRVWLE